MYGEGHGCWFLRDYRQHDHGIRIECMVREINSVNYLQLNVM